MAGRPRWSLPKGARIAVWTIVNVEEWDIERAMARQVLPAPQGVATVPDVPNWAWHDYGMRVGFWRFLDALTKRRIRATTAINAHVVESYEPVARAMLDAGWEFMGHGVVQGAMHLLPDQRAAIRQAVELLTKFTGKKPKGGWVPGSARRGRPRPARRRGHRVHLGLGERRSALRDPYRLRPAGLRALLAGAQRHPDDGDPAPHIAGVAAAVQGSIRPLYLEGARNPRVMAMAVHPYISGVPHRIKYFEAVYDYIRKQKGVWMTTGEEIYEWFTSQRRRGD
jgi:peptidoglycan/xylan/chitin deacetylase (PgdA/CDA1 family)